MHHIGLDIVEQALVVGDDDGRCLGSLQLVYSLGHDAQGIDVEARVGLVEDAEAGLQHGHLEDLVLLLLTAAEAFVDRAVGQLAVELHESTLLAHELEELIGGQGSKAAILALLVDGGTHEVDHAHARYLYGVLEREEQPLVAAVFGRQLQQVLSVKLYGTLRHLVGGMSHKHVAQCTLSRTIRAHDGMYLTGAHLKVYTLQYLFAIDAGMQVAYF